MKKVKCPREEVVLLFLVMAFWVALGIGPQADRFTWFMENFPVIFGVPILVLTHKKFRLTPLSYRLIFIHALILMVGGYYTYARVPLGFWMQDLFDFSRNHYDRIGHLAQGFVPVILIREFVLRKSRLTSGAMLNWLSLSAALAISALYEFLEWGTAVFTGTAADAFLGTQGDVWDTQWDMFLCLTGAMVSLAVLSRHHDRQLASVRLNEF